MAEFFGEETIVSMKKGNTAKKKLLLAGDSWPFRMLLSTLKN